MSALAELARSRELVANLTARELRGKYKRSVLGWGWSLLNPLATMLVFTLVFSFVLRVEVPRGDPSGVRGFALFLLCGLLPWNLVSTSMVGGIAALTANANLVKKVYFPREALVVSTVLALVVTLVLELAVLSVALVFFGGMVLPWLPVLAVLVALLTAFALGLALGLSVLNVYFRDVQYFVGIFLQMWFYATPIVYPLSLVRDNLTGSFLGVDLVQIYRVNPMTAFVEAFRDVLYDNRFPSLGTLGYLLAWSAVSLVAGYAVFRRFEGRLAEEL